MFGPSDFVAVLVALATETGAVEAARGSGPALRLSDPQLDLAIAMVQTLSDSGGQASAMEVGYSIAPLGCPISSTTVHCSSA